MQTTEKMALWQRMLLMRRFEERVIALAGKGHVAGHYHVYIGQEATGAAVIDALGPADMLFSTHRNHGHFIARGADPAAALAEILGRATGCNGGMGGSLHLADPQLGMPHTSAVLGGAPALAMGAGFEMARSGGDRIAVAFFGDGALEEGLALEALNMAALWKLPVLFVCENNSAGAIGAAKGGYPGSIIGTERLTALPAAFNIRHVSLDGNHMEGLRAAASDARKALIAGEGPVFMETNTPRWFGNQGLWPDLRHGPVDIGMATGETPLPGGPDADWFAAHDPILRGARELVAAGVPLSALHQADARITADMDAAEALALAAPFPDRAAALRNIFAGQST
ncbi:MAG: thiamine pyrophosphate-dependent dehydrogenase E1 component subunit alpha [Pararhodobacter sp.]|nr:thiamine pyrophosphate-dependent dehydrogenase E1 component subunit alpha [Pararhodobacter sp.]